MRTDPEPSRLQALARFRLLRPYAKRLLLAYALLLLAAGFQLLYPYAVARFVDASVAGAEMRWIVGVSLAMAAVLSVHAVCIALRHYLFASIGSMVVTHLRQRFFATLIGQTIGFFDAESVGGLTQRLSSDVERLQEALTVDAAMLAQTAVVGAGAAVMLFSISPVLALVVLLVAPIVVGCMRWVGARARELSRSKQEQLADCGRVAQEVLSNIRLVHAFTQEQAECRRFAASTDSSLRYSLAGDRLFAGLEGGATLVQSLALLVTVLIGGALVADRALTLGEFTSFLLYAGMAAGAATTVGALWGEWMRAFGATDRVFELLQRGDAGPTTTAATAEAPRLDREIRFEHVSFCYPTRPEREALSDFSLSIRPGERLALVGASGSGKSTVVNLLLGLYPPGSGQILIDGVPLDSCDLATARRQIAMVEQEPALFSSSILENIRYGAASEDIDSIAVREAARNAHVDEFALRFPDGYDTKVGARGAQLSGGQKQRVAIARALLRNPRLLILDEATSALDAESESAVQSALRRLMAGRTTIIIAHRLSTIRFADRVVVMREGRIVQIGSHNELMAQPGGYYQQLVARQSGDLLEPEVEADGVAVCASP